MAVNDIEVKFPSNTHTFQATKPGVYSFSTLQQAIGTLPDSTRNKMSVSYIGPKAGRRPTATLDFPSQEKDHFKIGLQVVLCLEKAGYKVGEIKRT